MKKIRYSCAVVIILTLLFFLLRSLNNRDLSKVAKIEDFYGKWIGKFEDRSRQTTLRFDDAGATFEYLPVQSSSGEVIFCSGSASVEFRSTYSIDAACVIIDCVKDGGYIFPVYFTENKKYLFYPISPGKGMNMHFNRN